MERRDIQKKSVTLFKSVICGLVIGSVAVCSAQLSYNSLPVPERSATSLNTGAIGSALETETSPAMQQAFLKREILSGNLPARSRRFQPVTWEAVCNDSDTLRVCKITLWVLSDYLAVGSDDQSLYVPLTPQTAQAIADEVKCILPTTEVVDRIYQQARIQLAPRPFSPVAFDISEPSTWIFSSKAIAHQISILKVEPNELLAGHKKDIVITRRLAESFNYPRVAIYGWHQLSGKPIQPLSLVHRNSYVDYSHGVRLISETMMLDGETTSVKSILENTKYAKLLSREGPLTSTTIHY